MKDESSSDPRALLAEIGVRDLPKEELARWRSAQQSLAAALARLPPDLAWWEEPIYRLGTESRRKLHARSGP